MPTSVVLQVLNVVLPVLTSMIKLSFESGQFAERCGLDIAHKNFRPVNSLLSKLSESAPVGV